MSSQTNSSQDTDDKKDFSKEAQLLFSVVEATGGSFGLAVPIYVLRGSSNQKVTSQMKQLPFYGKGKHISENWWKAFGRLLICEKYLQEVQIKSFGKTNMFGGCTVNITSKAKLWLEKAKRSPENESLIMEMNAELINLAEAKTVTIKKIAAPPAPVKKILVMAGLNTMDDNADDLFKDDDVSVSEPVDEREEQLQVELYKQLMALRNKIAEEEGIAPYMVLSNKNLVDIAVHRPISVQSLCQIEGIPSARASKFGNAMTELVKRFCEENSLETDVLPTPKTENESKKDLDPLIRQLSSTAEETYKLYGTDGKDLNEMAKRRGLSANTIVNHLIEAIKVGLPVTLTHLGVTKEIYEIVSKVIRSPPINSDVSRLTPIKQLCPEYVEFNHIKVIIALLQQKFGVNEIPIENSDSNKEGSCSMVEPPANTSESSSRKGICFSEDNGSPSLLKRKEIDYSKQTNLKKLKSSKLFKL